MYTKRVGPPCFIWNLYSVVVKFMQTFIYKLSPLCGKMRFLAILMVCVVSLLVVGCGEDSFDRTEYAFPVGYTPTVVVVEQEIPEAYNIYNPDSEVVRDYKTLTTSSMETSVYEDTYTAEEK